MPIYEYVCKKCGKEFDLLQKISDPPAKECPFCGGGVEKKLSLSSFQLKGSGWYLTDYSRKDKEKKEKKKKEGASEPSAKKESPPEPSGRSAPNKPVSS